MTNEVAVRFPWEVTPAATPTLEETVADLQRDFAYAVRYTAIRVHSNNPAFATLINTERGQIIPRNEVHLDDGTTIEFQDIGMCQPGVGVMTVAEIMAHVVETMQSLGIGFKK